MQPSIANYRAINQGSLKGGFTLLVGPFKILDCTYFEGPNGAFFKFPSKKANDGYIPLISMPDKEAQKKIQDEILPALKDLHANKVQGNTPQLPF